MNILVCIKQVPDDSVEISLNKEKNQPNLDGITKVVNAFDTYSLEMATRLKEKVGGEIVVLSIGDESVKNSLKNCLAVGADKAYLIKNDAFESLDADGISKLLIKGKEEIEKILDVKFDMIFCGKETTDYATSQVGLFIGEELNVPAVANVVDIEVEEALGKVKQETEEGYNVVEFGLPAVVTVQKPNYEPRYPTIKTKMAARKKPIEELGLEVEGGNKIEVVKIFEPAKRQAGVKIKAEAVEDTVAEAMKLIVEAKVL